MTPADLRQEIAAVFGEIMAAKRLARSGRTIELAGLDKRIGGLCEAVVLLPNAEGRTLLSLLENLNASLGELSEALKTGPVADTGGAS